MAFGVQAATTSGLSGGSGATLVANYKRTYTKVKTALNTSSKEWGWLKDLNEEDVDISATDIIITMDVNRGLGVAMMVEAGREARAVTPALVPGTLAIVWGNNRFQMSGHGRAYDKKSRAAMIRRQMSHQILKQMEAFGVRAATQTYGFSTGVVAKVITAVSLVSGTSLLVTLGQAFGDSSLNSGAYLGRLIQAGEQIAIINTTLVAHGEILTATQGASNLVVNITPFGATASVTSGMTVVFANNAYGETAYTLADHTDDSKWPVGFKDAVESTSVHGVSSTTYPNSGPAVNNSSGGRFSIVKQSSMEIAIQNGSPYDPTDFIIADDVFRDVQDGMGAFYMYTNPESITFNARVKFAYKTRRSPYCPAGAAYMWANDVVSKLVLTEMPGESGEGEVDKVQDFSRYAFSKNLGYGYVWGCRSAVAGFRNLTGQ